MPPAPAFRQTATSDAGRATTPRRLVIDAPTRMFHWLFALSFVGAYLTADGERWRALHVTLGYTMAALLAARILYGLFGPRHAGLGMLLRRLAAAPAWLRSIAQRLRSGSIGEINWRQGQNLAMALTVLALLVLVAPLALSGHASYEEWGGRFGGDWIGEMHEALGNALLAVVLVHIGLIAALSALRRANHARPMITGRLDGAGPDLVRRENWGLAALLLAASLAFVGWQWPLAPAGALQAQASTLPIGDRHHRDDDD